MFTFVFIFCMADIPDSQSAGGGEESVQAKAAGATLHLQAGGPVKGRRKIREKSEKLRGTISRTIFQKELLLKIIKKCKTAYAVFVKDISIRNVYL
jgi:hypothetical protein